MRTAAVRFSFLLGFHYFYRESVSVAGSKKSGLSYSERKHYRTSSISTCADVSTPPVCNVSSLLQYRVAHGQISTPCLVVKATDDTAVEKEGVH